MVDMHYTALENMLVRFFCRRFQQEMVMVLPSLM